MKQVIFLVALTACCLAAPTCEKEVDNAVVIFQPQSPINSEEMSYPKLQTNQIIFNEDASEYDNTATVIASNMETLMSFVDPINMERQLAQHSERAIPYTVRPKTERAPIKDQSDDKEKNAGITSDIIQSPWEFSGESQAPVAPHPEQDVESRTEETASDDDLKDTKPNENIVLLASQKNIDEEKESQFELNKNNPNFEEQQVQLKLNNKRDTCGFVFTQISSDDEEEKDDVLSEDNKQTQLAPILEHNREDKLENKNDDIQQDEISSGNAERVTSENSSEGMAEDKIHNKRKVVKDELDSEKESINENNEFAADFLVGADPEQVSGTEGKNTAMHNVKDAEGREPNEASKYSINIGGNIVMGLGSSLAKESKLNKRSESEKEPSEGSGDSNIPQDTSADSCQNTSLTQFESLATAANLSRSKQRMNLLGLENVNDNIFSFLASPQRSTSSDGAHERSKRSVSHKINNLRPKRDFNEPLDYDQEQIFDEDSHHQRTWLENGNRVSQNRPWSNAAIDAFHSRKAKREIPNRDIQNESELLSYNFFNNLFGRKSSEPIDAKTETEKNEDYELNDETEGLGNRDKSNVSSKDSKEQPDSANDPSEFPVHDSSKQTSGAKTFNENPDLKEPDQPKPIKDFARGPSDGESSQLTSYWNGRQLDNPYYSNAEEAQFRIGSSKKHKVTEKDNENDSSNRQLKLDDYKTPNSKEKTHLKKNEKNHQSPGHKLVSLHTVPNAELFAK